MSLDILEALKPAEVKVQEAKEAQEAATELVRLTFDQMKQHLIGMPVNWYPTLLAVMVKGAWSANAFEDGKIHEFVKNIEGALQFGLVPNVDLLSVFGLRGRVKLEMLHERLRDKVRRDAFPAKEIEWYEWAARELIIESLMYDLTKHLERYAPTKEWDETRVDLISKIQELNPEKYKKLVGVTE